MLDFLSNFLVYITIVYVTHFRKLHFFLVIQIVVDLGVLISIINIVIVTQMYKNSSLPILDCAGMC